MSLARTLANQPSVLLLDEPTSALDEDSKAGVESLIRLLGVTAVLVTHDIEEAVYLADRIVILKPSPGRLAADLRNDLPRPRVTSEVRYDPRFIEISRDIWHDLREEVQIG